MHALERLTREPQVAKQPKSRRQNDEASAKYAPLDPEEFGFAVRVAVVAATYRMPMPSPAEHHLDIEFPDGDTQRLVPKDIPIHRAAFAILEHCSPDPEKFQSIMARHVALIAMTKLNEAKQWVREDKDGKLLHPALIEAAAVMQLRSHRGFEREAFFQRVASIADHMGADDHTSE